MVFSKTNLEKLLSNLKGKGSAKSDGWYEYGGLFYSETAIVINGKLIELLKSRGYKQLDLEIISIPFKKSPLLTIDKKENTKIDIGKF